jgi:predicted phosphoribosyltransferase
MLFEDREEAGKALGKALVRLGRENIVVLALPRGGVPVARGVATALGVPLDLAISRKIGHPLQPEYAIGAVNEDGGIALNETERNSVPQDWLDSEILTQIAIARDYRTRYWGARPRVSLEARTVILVDDGVATGYTMLAAIRSVRKQGASYIVVAAPVAAARTRDKLCPEADECVFLDTPEDFRAVGYFYRDFRPVQDDQVISLLAA